ncbi:GAT domain-containing protein [Colletotrichum gloeosporioides Cg-14]|uniref:GAT domain-containing protein n=1 Tax=Colletotrichum gloeosporioides (strain Cg-14) TaxID=1237896 RepID=T0KC52_COLGC|nr:GAT domain-containing protein [Colletotrichum gloeosporioides Cg-14]
MKAMKGLSVNRMMSTLKKRTTTSFSGPGEVSAPDPQNDTPEAIAARSVRQFCESGGPNAQGDEVLYLPPIVEAAESSPAAAAECARIIRKYLSKDNMAKASWQYNAIMLIRILTDNPGPTFTRNMDKKFADTVKDLFRSTRDPSVRQMIMETLDTFEMTKFDDHGLGELIAMWKREKEKSFKQHGEVLDNDLIKEFADRCQSASRSVQLYMRAENPSPDNDTMENLIDTNEQLQSALNQHQRAVLGARKQLGIGARSENASPISPQSATGQHSEPPQQQWSQAQSSSSSSTPAPVLPARPAEGNGKGKAAESFAPPPGPPPKSQPEPPAEDPFKDPQPQTNHSSSSKAGGSGYAAELPSEEPRLAFDPYHPGFNTTPSYLGRQDSAVGKVTMHGADAATTPGPLSGNPIQTVDLRDRHEAPQEASDDDLYESTPKKRNQGHRY